MIGVTANIVDLRVGLEFDRWRVMFEQMRGRLSVTEGKRNVGE
jgi:hypothetical protein